MKNILTLIAIFLASNIYAQKYVLLEINSEWNLRNSAKIHKIKNVEYRIAYLEEQTPAFKKKIRSSCEVGVSRLSSCPRRLPV